jgi:acyl-CoA thioesterase-1
MPSWSSLLRPLLFAGSLALAAGAAQAKVAVVTILGDSLTAGYGLQSKDAIPAQLQIALKAIGVAAVVRPAGVSGDTSADGLARADFSVKPDTDLAIVALGGNDLLQGVEPAVIRANLAAIVAKLKARRIPVLLAGVKAPPAMGQAYARDFDAVVPEVAHRAAVAAYPDLLGKVALDRALNQGDGVHPNPRGAKIVAARLAPAVAAALKSKR